MAKLTTEIKPELYGNKPNRIYSGIMVAFIILTLTVFPLFYDNYYFNIMRAKYAFYYVSVLAAFSFCLIITLVYMFIDQRENEGEQRKRILAALAPKKLWKSLTIAEKTLLIFLTFAIISTLQSDYVYEAFWGNEGRYSGLFLISLYCLSVLLIGRLARIRKWHLELFLLASVLVCLFGITDYFNMDVLHFKVNLKPNDAKNFTSTMGNINTYTAYVALAVGVSAGLFATEKNIFRAFFHYIVVLVTFFAIITGQSDNAYLALGALFGLMPLIAFTTRTGIKRCAILIAGFITILKLIADINLKMPDKVIGLSGIFRILTQYDKLSQIVIAIWLLVIVLYIGDWILLKNKEDRLGNWPRIIWGALLAAGIAAIVYVLYDANFGGDPEKYQAISQYVIFNDSWGTSRGYCWRIGWESYRSLPLQHRLFGFGPDTFGILTWDFRAESIEQYGVFYESAHNEYFQYLVTMGPFALAAYLAFLGSSCWLMIKNFARCPWILGPLAAVVCYGAQALVNINLPIATPVMWTLLAVGLAVCREASQKSSAELRADGSGVTYN